MTNKEMGQEGAGGHLVFGQRRKVGDLWRCAWCGKEEPPGQRKWTAKYCNASCRKRAWMAKQEQERAAGQMKLGDEPPVKPASRAVSAGSVGLTEGERPQPLTSPSGPTGPEGCLAASDIFVMPEWAEIGGFLEHGAWAWACTCWERAAKFQRGHICLEVYESPYGGWAGCLKWVSPGGTVLRYSHNVTAERYRDVQLELDMIFSEVLGRAEQMIAVGEGGL